MIVETCIKRGVRCPPKSQVKTMRFSTLALLLALPASTAYAAVCPQFQQSSVGHGAQAFDCAMSGEYCNSTLPCCGYAICLWNGHSGVCLSRLLCSKPLADSLGIMLDLRLRALRLSGQVYEWDGQLGMYASKRSLDCSFLVKNVGFAANDTRFTAYRKNGSASLDGARCTKGCDNRSEPIC